MNVYIETHGCKLNIADSQKISDKLLSSGMEISNNIKDSDIYVLNTCTVTKSADKKARNKLRSIKKQNPNIHVVATGCYVQRDKKEISELGIVNTIINNEEKDNFLDILSKDVKFKFDKKLEQNNIDNILLGRTRGSVAIQKGCNQICSYCIVPKVRGREESISPESIIASLSQRKSASSM